MGKEDKKRPESKDGSQVLTPLEWLRSRFDYEYVKHQPQHKKEKS